MIEARPVQYGKNGKCNPTLNPASAPFPYRGASHLAPGDEHKKRTPSQYETHHDRRIVLPPPAGFDRSLKTDGESWTAKWTSMGRD